MTPRDAQALLDILVAGRLIAEFIAEIDGPTRLEKDPLLSSAVAWQFSVIGEAARRFSREARSANPSVPWADMARLRNRIAHGYDTIDWMIVWRVATNELPVVVKQIEVILTAHQVPLSER